jgi:hypothetical protein
MFIVKHELKFDKKFSLNEHNDLYGLDKIKKQVCLNEKRTKY